MNKYKIIAIVGKAGSGKDSILEEVMSGAIGPYDFHEIVSYTTREPRQGEIDGFSYHFVDKYTFADMVHDGRMLEYTKFNSWLYGTALNSLSNEKINIGVFNPSGIISLMNRPDVDLYVIYITATDKERLLRQLTREENPDVREVLRRYDADEDDFYLFEQHTISKLKNFIRIENPNFMIEWTLDEVEKFLDKIV